MPTSDLKIIGGTVLPSDQKVKGELPYTIGIGADEYPTQAGNCTATRIGENLYLTAAHCLNKAGPAWGFKVYASNSFTPYRVLLTNVRISFDYKGKGEGLDLATFSIQYLLTEQKTSFESFVDIASISTAPVSKGMPTVIAGFGCVKEDLVSNCTEETFFKYMKKASSLIDDAHYWGDKSNKKYFQLALTKSANEPTIPLPATDGYVGLGDSGGPVFHAGKLIGVTADGVSLLKYGVTNHVWLGHPDAIDFVNKSRAGASSPVFFSGKQILMYPVNGGTQVYTGTFKDGFMDGIGSMTYPLGKTYEGQWVKSKREGQGTLTYAENEPDYSTYVGAWANDNINGKGRLTYKKENANDFYDGYLENGTFHGKGLLQKKDGSSMDGNFIQGKPDGIFILKKGGKTFQGEYKEGALLPGSVKPI